MTKQLKLPQRAWFGDTEIEISFPEDWQVSVHGMAVDNQKPLSDQYYQK